MRYKFISDWISAIIILTVPAIALSEQWESFPLRRDGAITAWTVAGSLPNSHSGLHGEKCFGYYKDYLLPQGGEKNANPFEEDRIVLEDGSSIIWRSVFSDSSGLLDYINIFGVERGIPGVAYAFCQLVSDKKQQVVLRIRSDDGVRAWLNHQMIHDHHVGRSVDNGVDQVPVILEKGDNPLLVKVDQGTGKWGLGVTIVNENGKPNKSIRSSIGTKKPLKGKIRQASVQPSPFVIRTLQGDRQIIIADFISGGLENFIVRLSNDEWQKPVEMRVSEIPPGKSSLQIKVPVIKKNGVLQALLQSATDQVQLPAILVQKPREWVIYLVQHEHTDIGYTRSQNEMLPENLRFIDYALDYCEMTDGFPDDAKFRWTCEASSPVQEFLKRRPPQQIERLKKRVAEGRVEITGMFLNMSDIATENELAASVQPIRDFKLAGLPVKTAMQNDVNGIAWCMADYLSDCGVKYLTMGINRTRSILPFDKPTAFWWESPSGKRLLAYRADIYHKGNYWQIHEGYTECFQDSLLRYLQWLEKGQYPFDRIAVQFSGSYIDNSPPSIKACKLVKNWNEAFLWPKLRLATAQEYLNYVEINHGDKLPVYRVAWPDWWTDGFASGARETAVARKTQWAIQADQALLSMAALSGTPISADTHARVTDVHKDLLFFDEHTFGADVSISDAMNERNLAQWGQKSAFAWDALKNEALLREEALGLLQPYVRKADVPTIAVFNTLNWVRSGLTELFIDHEILPANTLFKLIDSENTKEIPVQLLSSRREGSYWAIYAKDVPALGYKTFRIDVGDTKQLLLPMDTNQTTELENDFYRLVIDAKKGAVISLFDKEMGVELVDRNNEWNFGQLIYEKTRMGRDFNKDNFIRCGIKGLNKISASDGSIWKAAQIAADIEGCEEPNGVQVEIRLFKSEKRIEILFDLRKRRITDGEAYYVAFPFSLPDARIIYETQGGVVTPGVTQLPGSASDWQTIQSFAAVRSNKGQILFTSLQAPLVQFGDINLGKWQQVSRIEKPHIYSWVMNNYWYTNFQSIQEGELKWSYAITSTGDTSNAFAAHFGWSACMPLIARAFPPGKDSVGKSSLSLMELKIPTVGVVSTKPALNQQGVILHLRELEGKSTFLALKDNPFGVKVKIMQEVNVLEDALSPSIAEISFKPFEAKFVKLVLEDL